ncbi:hypothetical protein BGU54_18545 [Clostridioides difficile]|nr:hypothetical protein BGU54_18545 [Clostridioides difficile]
MALCRRLSAQRAPRQHNSTGLRSSAAADGDKRQTIGRTEGCQAVRWSYSLKATLRSDCRLKLAYMKLELLVLADQNAAVNAFPGLVHTARHTTGVGDARSRLSHLLEDSGESGAEN